MNSSQEQQVAYQHAIKHMKYGSRLLTLRAEDLENLIQLELEAH